MSKKGTTIEGLAVMVKKGFDAMDKRMDQMATKTELQELRKEVFDQFELIHADIRDIKIAIGPLVRVISALESEVRSLRMRIDRLEKKAGFSR